MNLLFTPITQQRPGIIARLLRQSYAEILAAEKRYWPQEEKKWSRFDREAFENPETVGRCVFITSWEDTVIGFGSFDPRQRPEIGIIGHNCILPPFRGRGYGRRQLLEILSRLEGLEIKRATASTSEHPFFLPAQRMYLSCGFEERRRYIGGPDPRYRMIEYIKNL